MKRKRRITFFSGAVLVVLVILLVSTWMNGKNELFKTETVLYAETVVGTKPTLDFEKYFADKNYDSEKFTWAIEEDALVQPGTIMIPVYYEGERTKCQVQLTVKAKESVDVPEAKGQELKGAE